MVDSKCRGSVNLTKVINIIVGGNGSGKTTFYYRYLKRTGLPFLNADELAKSKWPDAPEAHSYEAAKEVERVRQLLLANQQSFCFETVFSHASKVDFLALAKSYGYNINLFVIHIDDHPATNIARVSNRKSLGGHGVPEDKIVTRIPRMLENVARAVPLCDTVSFYDNSSSKHPFKPVAVLKVNQILLHIPSLPSWAKACIGERFNASKTHHFREA